MINNKDYSERKGSLIVLTIVILLILVIILIAVAVLLSVEKHTARIVLYCLLGLLFLIALFSCFFVESRRRDAQRERDKGATDLVRHIYEEQRHHVQTGNGGSQQTVVDGNTATWALTQPWRYSQRSTLKV